MARNVEIKAAARNFEYQHKLAKHLASGPAKKMIQRDIFYNCGEGRLKLRFENEEQGYLVSYRRADQQAPKLSAYQLFPTEDPGALDICLTKALGVRGIVEKQRTLFLVGQTRVHLDVVVGLGEFVELEVVLREDQGQTDGENIARRLMGRLNILSEDLLHAAYLDMLEKRRGTSQE